MALKEKVKQSNKLREEIKLEIGYYSEETE
jgi:hypothetical protein